MKDLKKRVSGVGVEGGLPPQKKLGLKSSTNKENKIILKISFFMSNIIIFVTLDFE